MMAILKEQYPRSRPHILKLSFLAALMLVVGLSYAGSNSQAKTVLITGGVSGLGKEIAKAFQEDGWNVWVTSRAPGNDVLNNPIKKIQLDLGNEKSIVRAVNLFKKHNKRLDVLINNAGYGLLGPIESVSIEQVRKQFEVNVFGALKITQACLPFMQKQQSGVVINVSTAAAIRALPGLGAYSASKMALEGISEAMAAELNPWNIHVSLVQPGSVHNNWIKNCELGEKRKLSTKCEQFTKNFQAMGTEVSKSGQMPQQIAALILSIAKAKKPHFRYQTNEYVADLAKQIYRDPSGNQVREEMIQLCQGLGL